MRHTGSSSNPSIGPGPCCSFGHENPWKCEDLELTSLKSLARRCGKCATAGRLEDEKGNVTEVRCDKLRKCESSH